MPRGPRKTDRPRNKAGGNIENDFRWISRQVEALGSSKLKGQRKREWEIKKKKAMGALPPKNIKAPYKALMGMRAKQKQREAKYQAIQKERGVDVHKLKFRENALNEEKYLNKMKGDNRGDFRNVGDGSRGLKATTFGTYSNGILYLNKDYQQRLEQNPKKSITPKFGDETKPHGNGGKKRKRGKKGGKGNKGKKKRKH